MQRVRTRAALPAQVRYDVVRTGREKYYCASTLILVLPRAHVDFAACTHFIAHFVHSLASAAHVVRS